MPARYCGPASCYAKGSGMSQSRYALLSVVAIAVAVGAFLIARDSDEPDGLAARPIEAPAGADSGRLDAREERERVPARGRPDARPSRGGADQAAEREERSGGASADQAASAAADAGAEAEDSPTDRPREDESPQGTIPAQPPTSQPPPEVQGDDRAVPDDGLSNAEALEVQQE